MAATATRWRIGLMVLCAVLPYLFFRWKKWL